MLIHLIAPRKLSTSNPSCFYRYLLVHDSVHGKFPGTVEVGRLVVD